MKNILILILGIILIILYLTIFKQNIDKNSYIELISGKGVLNNVSLVIGEKQKLKENDEIKTGFGKSMAIIEWGDGSITRLGENTHLQVDENYFSDDGNIIKVIFKIFSGKTWSNILSYIPGDSHFKQVFDDTEVAVRGTIYTIDLEKKYLYVENHRVILTEKNGKVVEVKEKKPISTKTFNFISLSDFILKLKDKVFFKENKDLDKKFYLILKQNLRQQLKNLEQLKNLNIQKLSEKEIQKVYKKVLSSYQKLNFISTVDGEELFGLKIDLKEKLMNLSSVGEKANLAKSFFYDFKDMVSNKNFYSFDRITKVLIENKSYFDFQEFTDFINNLNLKENLENTIKQNFKDIEKTFNTTIFYSEKIINGVNKLNEKARESIIDFKNNTEKDIKASLNDAVKGKEFLEQKLSETLKDGVENLEGVIKDSFLNKN